MLKKVKYLIEFFQPLSRHVGNNLGLGFGLEEFCINREPDGVYSLVGKAEPEVSQVVFGDTNNPNCVGTHDSRALSPLVRNFRKHFIRVLVKNDVRHTARQQGYELPIPLRDDE